MTKKIRVQFDYAIAHNEEDIIVIAECESFDPKYYEAKNLTLQFLSQDRRPLDFEYDEILFEDIEYMALDCIALKSDTLNTGW